MSVEFIPVQWNRQKAGYDLIITAGFLLFIAIFVLAGTRAGTADAVILLIRALGLSAFTSLHVILLIGPLARLSDRFKPWLYNRRHIGVLTALVGLAHAALVLAWYHGSGIVDPLASAIGGYGDYGVPIEFPFETFGLIALLILLTMAATSHDFWLSWLSPPVWKALHMSVYVAYAALVGHVALGTAQFDTSSNTLWAVGMGSVLITSAHIAAIAKGRADDKAEQGSDGWLPVPDALNIPLNRARTIMPPEGERIAVFRYDNGFAAILAVCSHQNGPLGEGCIKEGLITCPWHGFQFDPETGEAPAPFEDKVQTHSLKFEDGQLWVSATPNPLGVKTLALRIDHVE